MQATAEIAALKLALQASEQKLRALSDSHPVGVYHCDETGARTYTNERWQQIVGLAGERSLGHAWLQALHPDDRDQGLAAWRDTVTSGRGFDMEFRDRPPGRCRSHRAVARGAGAGRRSRRRLRGRAR